MPVFVRAGSILPRQAVVQHDGETPAGPLLIDVYPGGDCAGTLYADDGHSMAFEKGGYARQTVRCTVRPDGLDIAFAAREGRYTPWWREIRMTVHAMPGAHSVTADGRMIAAVADAAAETLHFTLPAPRGARTIALRRR
jgi:alpha-glucosidase